MKINTNVTALSIYQNLKRTDRKAGLSMQKLSSGLKINSVADDAAGLAISNKLRFQIGGLKMASKNVLDGVSLVQTADGALGEVHSIVQRIRELAVQSANDALTADDRVKLAEEASQLMSEIDAISQRTEFNGIRLLDGSVSILGKSVQNGAPSDHLATIIGISDGVPEGTLNYTVDRVPAPAEVKGGIAAGMTFPEGTVTINGEVVRIGEGDTLDTVLDKLREAAVMADIDVFAPDYPPGPSELILTSRQVGGDASVTIGPPGSNILAALGLAPGEAKGVDAQISGISFTNSAGRDITSFNDIQNVSYNGRYVTISGKNGHEITLKLNMKETDGAPFEGMGVVVTGHGPITLQTGGNKGMEMEISIPNMTAEGLALDRINLKSRAGAEQAMSMLDKAVASVSTTRGMLGSYQNRLEFVITGLQSTEDALTTAQSRLMDTDMAAEMTNYTQLNIISQAGISIMAQANQRPHQILQLLG